MREVTDLSLLAAPTTTGDARTWRHSRNAEVELSLRGALAAAGLLIVWPLAALALSSVLLVNLQARTPRPVRVGLGLILAMSLAMLTGGRPLDAAESNDIEGYHLLYQGLAESDYLAFEHFGAGLEVGLPLLMLAWARLLPALSQNGLMFCLSLTGAVLLLVWFEATFYNGQREASPPAPALLGIGLLLVNLYFATQLSRQFLSLVVLLYACTATTRTRQALFVALAASLHLTAIPFYAVYLLLRRGPWGWLAVLAGVLVLRLYFAALLDTFDILPEAASQKLVYYLDDLDSAVADLASLRMLGLLAFISLGPLLAWRLRPPASMRVWLIVPWLAIVIHLLLLPVPLASMRTTLIVHAVLPGLIAFRMLAGQQRLHGLAVFNVLVAYKVYTYATSMGAAALQPAWTTLRSFLL